MIATPTSALAAALTATKRSEAASSSLAVGGRGGRSMTPGLRSSAMASAGGPSATKLIQSSCTAVSGSRNVPPAGSLMPSRKAKPETRRHEKDQGEVGGEEEADELLDVLVDVAPFLDGSDDGCEIVVHEHDIGHLARDVAAALAHGDADVGALQRRRVVHPVAGDRDDLAQVLQRLDQAQLVLGRYAGEDIDHAGRLAQLLRRKPIDVLDPSAPGPW